MTRPALEPYMLSIAKLVAGRGTCPRKQVGCVLVDAKGRILATGYNGTASGAAHCADIPCPGAQFASGHLDKCEAIHAEQNALLQCKDPDAVRTAFVTLAPCPWCAKLFLATGCATIYYIEPHSTLEQTALILRNRARLIQMDPWTGALLA